MITRLYVDNFRTLVNFEWKPGRIALLMGANGSGKSSVIDVLSGVRAVIRDNLKVRFPFPRRCRARWEARTELTIELDVELPQAHFAYRLSVEHDFDGDQATVKRETLHAGDLLLVEFADKRLRTCTDHGVEIANVDGDVERSGVGATTPGKDNRLLATFKDWLADNTFFLKPDPRAMSAKTDGDTDGLQPDVRNFASWLAEEMKLNFAGVAAAATALRQALPGFESLQVNRSRPRLDVVFRTNAATSYTVSFDELSDGQRLVCALYVVRHLWLLPQHLAIFDEPDNYVALREIQPWLDEVLDLARAADGPQVWFVSHHPELINQLAPSHGVRFFRRDGGPTRIEPFVGAAGLTAAETVARGWDGE